MSYLLQTLFGEGAGGTAIIANDPAVGGAITPGAQSGSRVPIFLTGWKLERFHRLRKLFLRVDKRGLRGQALYRAMKLPSWYVRKHGWRAARGRKVRLSQATLTGLFYLWKRFGDAALILGYCGPVKDPDGKHLRRLVAACIKPGVITLKQAKVGFVAPIAARTLDNHLPASARSLIKQIHALRRKEAGLIQELGKVQL